MTARGSWRERSRRNLLLFVRFGAVGASGVLVNLLVVVLVNQVSPAAESVFLDLPLTRFNVRWYHVISTVAFVVANLWNFQLNRVWAFRSHGAARWWSEYPPFLLVGLVGQAVGLGLLTLLMHPGSWLSLSPEVFDNSSGLTTRLYWAQVVVLAVVTPVSFVLNKYWTFRAVRAPGAADPAPVKADPTGRPRG